jgi:hypothetical protein
MSNPALSSSWLEKRRTAWSCGVPKSGTRVRTGGWCDGSNLWSVAGAGRTLSGISDSSLSDRPRPLPRVSPRLQRARDRGLGTVKRHSTTSVAPSQSSSWSVTRVRARSAWETRTSELRTSNRVLMSARARIPRHLLRQGKRLFYKAAASRFWRYLGCRGWPSLTRWPRRSGWRAPPEGLPLFHRRRAG